MRTPAPRLKTREHVRTPIPILTRRRIRLTMNAALGLAFLACADGTPTSPAASELAVPGSPAGLIVADPGVDYTDTWVSATQTVADTTRYTTTQPLTDPATGAQTYSLTVGDDPQTVQVLGGYGYDGQLRVTTGYNTANPIETASVRQVGDATSDYSQNGDANYDALDAEPTATLGTLQYAQLSVSPSGGTSCADQGTCVAQMNLVAGSGSASIPTPQIRRELVDASHLRITERMPTAVFSPPTVAMQSQTNPDQSAKREAKQIREYEKHGADWVIKHIRQEASASQDGKETRHIQEIQFSNVQFFVNKKKDKERKEAREKLLAQIDTTASLLAPARISPLIACDPTTCGGGGGGGGSGGGTGGGTTSGYAYEPRVDEAAQIQSDETSSAGSSQTTLVLQHGFVSSADTWRPMHHWLAHDLNIGAITRKSLNWKDTYENQAGRLAYRLSYENYIPYRAPVILVGHSNGGMISRYLARNPGQYNVTSVVTVGTPHKGAPAARYLRSLALVFGWGPFPAAVICPIFGMAGCTRFGELATQPVSAYWRSLWDPVPVLNEMQPNSAYHASFNAQPESFNRFGIESYIWQHWQIWKQNGDMKCFPEESCGGYKEVKKTDRIYHHDLSCSVVGFFTFNWLKAFKCGLDAGFLKGIDGVYNKYTRDGDTDGIVPKYSQLYPNIPADHQYEIYDGPSHTGETKAVVVRDRLETVLRRLGIVPK